MKFGIRFSSIFAVSFLSLFASMARSQAPTLTTSNTPLAVSSFTVDTLNLPNFQSPNVGTDETWNFATTAIVRQHPEQFYTSTDPAYSASAIYDTIGFEPIASPPAAGNLVFGIEYHDIYDRGSNGITNPGISFPSEAFNVDVATGGTDDSLWVLAQDALYSTPESYLALPATMGTNWSTSNAKRTINMQVKVAALSLFGYPAITDFKKISSFSITDSVVGWGTIQVPTPNGPSAPMPTLMVKIASSRTDSAFLNDTIPYPVIFLEFGLPAEGQDTTTYSYAFFTEGSILPILKVEYTDGTYSQPKAVYGYPSAASSSVATANASADGAHLFPNPAHSNAFYLQSDRALTAADRIEVDDVTGTQILSEQCSGALNGTLMNISLPSNAAPGTYFVRVLDASGAQVLQSKLEIAP